MMMEGFYSVISETGLSRPSNVTDVDDVLHTLGPRHTNIHTHKH
jgi:hypothetical protein